MVPSPTATGLSLCDYVIVEERTKKVSLIGTFSGLKVPAFPAIPQSFCVFASLTDGQGDGMVELTVTELTANDEIYSLQRPAHFPDRLAEVQILFRLKECGFPAAGLYLFTLSVDNEWVAHKRLRVYSSESAT
jgi:hypothetical protein